MLSTPIVILVGTILRLGLFFDTIGPAILPKYTQCAALQSILFDPKYTLENLKETIFVSKHMSDGGNSHPLIFAVLDKLITKLPQDFDHDLAFSILALLIDLAIACQLYRLAKVFIETQTEHMKWEQETEQNMNAKIYPIKPSRTYLFGLRFDDDNQAFPTLFATANIPALCAMVYYFNPITILASANGVASIQGLWILLLVSTLMQAGKGNAPLAGLYLAILCHVDIYNIIFVIPSALLWKHHYEFKSAELKTKRPSMACKSNLIRAFTILLHCLVMMHLTLDETFPVFIVSFLFWFILVNLAALILHGWSWSTLIEMYDVTRNFDNMAPNLGLQWYLAVNTFTRFRPYFAVMCSGFVFLFCIPLLIRFYYYPMEMVSERQCAHSWSSTFILILNSHRFAHYRSSCFNSCGPY